MLDTGQNFWQESSFGPGQHAFVGSLVAAIEKAVRLSIVAVEITIDRNALLSICLLLHDFLEEMKLFGLMGVEPRLQNTKQILLCIAVICKDNPASTGTC